MEGYSKPISKTTCYDIELWLPKDSLFQSSQRFCRNGFYLTSRRTLSQKDSRFLGYDVYFLYLFLSFVRLGMKSSCVWSWER